MLSSNIKSSPSNRPPEEARALKLFIVLSRAQQAIARHAEADVMRHGLTLPEFAILEVLYHQGPLRLGEIQQKILVTSGGMTYLVDRLEKKGLVERSDCPEDRRVRYAALTESGAALIGGIFDEHVACIVRAVSGLDGAEQQEAVALLRKLGRAAASMPLAHEASS